MSKIAVIKTGGKQYKVHEGMNLKIEKLLVDEGKEVVFDQVFLVADEKGEDVKLGKPVVEGAKVSATVLKQGRHPKITVIKYKAKTRYKRTKGHKQLFTQVKINKISV